MTYNSPIHLLKSFLLILLLKIKCWHSQTTL
nr:MAG TPA: hypothetical protein [Caudoviricetes sp.]